MIDQSKASGYPATLLAETREELARADGKASILLGATGVVAGVLLGTVAAGDWSPRVFRSGLAEILWWVAVAVGAIGVVALARAVMPRVRHPGTEHNVYYFGHVIQYRPRKRKDRKQPEVMRRGQERFAEDLEKTAALQIDRTTDQIWVLSFIVHQKYWNISAALWSFALAGSLFAGAAIVENVWGS